MADQKQGKGSGLEVWIPLMFIFMVGILLLLALASFVSGGNSCSGPCPQADTLPQALNPTDPAAQALANQVKSFNNSAAFLAANAKDLDALRTQIVTVKEGIEQGKTGFTSFDKTKTIPLLDKMITDLDQIRLTLTKKDPASKQKLATLVKQFTDNSRAFSSLIPGTALACSNGGFCLDVPAVVQGGDDWCGKTSTIMVMLYYTKGAIISQLNGFVTTKNGRLVSDGPGNSGYVNENNLAAASKNNDWVRISTPKGNSTTSGADITYNMLRNSIKAGDPVIAYTYGMLYPRKLNSKGKPRGHIVPVVGYNDSNQSIYVNNSATFANGGTTKATNTGTGGKVLTKDFVYANLGDSGAYAHSFFIRKEYIKSL